MSDQRAFLDECTNRPGCPAEFHMNYCPGKQDARTPDHWLDWLLGLDRHNQLTAMRRFLDWRRAYRDARRREEIGAEQLPSERQVWEKLLADTVTEKRIHLEVDAEGRVRLHEALVAQLLVDAGWERTA